MKTFVIIAVIYLIVINIIAFALMGIDKARAQKQKWRIPEKTLFLPVILGGGIGGIAGMHVFRHKTKHWYFAIGFPAILIIEVIAVVCLFVFTDIFR